MSNFNIDDMFENMPRDVMDIVFGIAKSFSRNPDGSKLLLRAMNVIWDSGVRSGFDDGYKAVEVELKRMIKDRDRLVEIKMQEAHDSAIDVEFVIVAEVKH